MVKNIIKASLFTYSYICYCKCCKNPSGKTKGESNTESAENLKKKLEELNIDDNDIISFNDFISGGAKFDSSKSKVKFDNNAVVDITKFADKFKNYIVDLNEQNVYDMKIDEKLKVFIDRIIECLKTKLNNGYKLDDNNLNDLYIVAEFKSENNNITSEALKFIGDFKKNMSYIFKKCSNVYVLNNFIDLPVNKDKGCYSSKIYNEKNDKEQKNEYSLNCTFMFKDKNNKEDKIGQDEKAGVNDYYGVINLKDYKNYYVSLKK